MVLTRLEHLDKQNEEGHSTASRATIWSWRGTIADEILRHEDIACGNEERSLPRMGCRVQALTLETLPTQDFIEGNYEETQVGVYTRRTLHMPC